jgi:hypothetical protein
MNKLVKLVSLLEYALFMAENGHFNSGRLVWVIKSFVSVPVLCTALTCVVCALRIAVRSQDNCV